MGDNLKPCIGTGKYLAVFSSKLSCLNKISSSESNFGWLHTVGDITLRLKLGGHKRHVSNKKSNK